MFTSNFDAGRAFYTPVLRQPGLAAYCQTEDTSEFWRHVQTLRRCP